MRGMLAIAKKDMRAVYASPLFYFVGFLCTILWTFFFIYTLENFRNDSQNAMMRGPDAGPNLHLGVFFAFISLVNFFMILASAAVTMKLFAEEKKQRSYDLLMTSPVTATEIVLGKYLGALGGIFGFIVLSFLYPVALLFVTKFEWGPLLSSYLGLFLLTAVYIAMGMFASSLTENLALAAIMALVFNVGILFLSGMSGLVQNEWARKVVDHLSINNNMMNFLKGSISTSSVIVFLSLAGFCIFLTQRVVESSRWR